MPKVSICIPAYEQVEYLRISLDSILIQNYIDYEIIITDDSKSDSVEGLVKNYNFKGKLKYFRNSSQLGSPGNWNEAIRKAAGEYIKILHHDDWFTDRNSLKKYVELLDGNPEVDFVFSACNSFNGDKLIPWNLNIERLERLRNNPYRLIIGNIIGAPSVTIYRRRFIGKFDESLKWLVDIEFYIQILEYNPKFIFSQECLMNICSNGSHQVTNECHNDRDIELSEYVYLYNKYYGRFKWDMDHNNLINYLFNKYNIRCLNDLRSIPLKSEIPKPFSMKFSRVEKIKKLVKKTVRFALKKLKTLHNLIVGQNTKLYKKSYSQCGEDMIIDFIFYCLRIDKPSFIDIGAHDPFWLSNTAFFYNKGCTGINVEPNPNLIKKFKKHRKKDINLNFGIAKSNSELPFYIMSASTMSTFSREEAQRLEQETSLRIVEEKMIPVIQVQSILDNYTKGVFPDFLSLDVEGYEKEILESINFEKSFPKVICLETLTYSEKNDEKKEIDTIEFLIRKGYFIYGDTYINTIFVKKSLWETR